MPQDINSVRDIQGRFHNKMLRDMGRLTATGPAPPFNRELLHVRNAHGLVAAMLLLSAVVAPRPGGRLIARAHGETPSHLPTRAALLAGADAAGGVQQPLMQQGGLPKNLDRIANGGLAICAANPSHCSKALVAGAALAAGTFVAGFVTGQASVPNCPAEDTASPVPLTQAPAALSPPLPLEDALLAALSPEARRQILEIVSGCEGAPDCAEPEIRDLLAAASPADQQRLQQLLPAEEMGAAPAGLPGASAALLHPIAGWLDVIATLLSNRITPEIAAYELDVAAIADATHTAQAQDTPLGSPREAINQARLSAIAERFTRLGFHVQPRPFALTTNTLFGYPQVSKGNNLLIELNGAGPPRRTLMLLAHGDVAGADAGSSGALDNASGVAALLALAKQFKAVGLPANTRVQLLVTDKEEWGLHGAKAYVESCTAATDCPDLAVNVDVLGIGDGITLSGSEQHPFYRDGDSAPRGEPVTPAGADEQRMAALLRGAAAEVGLRVYEAPDWTMQSDHIAFQRAAVPALGISQVDAPDFGTEGSLQRTRDLYLKAEDAVPWTKYEAFVDGTLDPTEMADMERLVDASDTAMAAYRLHPLSHRQQLVHNAADQPERVDPRRALAVIDVVQRAALAWLAAAAPHPDR